MSKTYLQIMNKLGLSTVAKNGSTVRYVGTVLPQFLLRSTVRWYGTFFCNGTGTVRYAFFAKVRVRYVGTLFELKIPDFSHIAPVFCTQRQKTVETDVKCVISKSVIVASSQKQVWQYGTVRRYGTPQSLLKSTVRWYGTFFAMVRVRYVGTVRFKN